MQAKLTFIAGATLGSVNPHANVGYTVGGRGLTFESSESGNELTGNEPSPELNYTAGADVAVTPVVTIAADVIGRALQNSANITVFDDGNQSADRSLFFDVEPGTVNLLLGAVGIKIKVGNAWLLTGTVLFPLNDKGVKPAVTPVIGFERAF